MSVYTVYCVEAGSGILCPYGRYKQVSLSTINTNLQLNADMK